MSYKESSLDQKNKRWFENNQTVNSLLRLTVSGASIRGINPSSIEFKYPITAIAGENGSGKSTLLALIACSFHNESSFCPRSLQNNSSHSKRHYYTYSDFFTFTANENGLNSNIEIKSEYKHDPSRETKKTAGIDIRKKKVTGKWTDYNTRPRRVVSFLGINRILPPAESKTYRNYAKQLKDTLSPINNQELTSAMSQIFGHSYSDIKIGQHNTYSLFSANQGDVSYTGFNMGAGENAVLALLYEIITAGTGALIVVDEIELGLHISAQKMLIQELKKLCNKYQCQIVCSTHSKCILEELPPYARVLIKSFNGKTELLTEITPEFALSVLSKQNVPELKVFVEDDIGADFLNNILPLNIRSRIMIIPVGSADGSIPRQMAASYREHNLNFCSVLDGDKRTQTCSQINKVKHSLEDRLNHSEEEFKILIQKRLLYLPGNTWPEKYLLEELKSQQDKSYLECNWDAGSDEIVDFVNAALTAGKHNEFYTLANNLSLNKRDVVRDVIMHYKMTHQNEVSLLISSIRQLLD